MYTGQTIVFFYWGHCEFLASLVGLVRVLSAVMLLWNCFRNKQNDDDDDDFHWALSVL